MGGISAFLVLVLVLSRYIFKDFIKYTINKVKRVKVVEEEPKNLDLIILKRGSEIKGNIIEDKDGQIIISIELDKGKGTLVIDKSEITHIQYGVKPSPQDNPQLKSEKTK